MFLFYNMYWLNLKNFGSFFKVVDLLYCFYIFIDINKTTFLIKKLSYKKYKLNINYISNIEMIFIFLIKIIVYYIRFFIL